MNSAASAGRYRLSFTFGGLLIPETRSIAASWQETGDWTEIHRRCAQENLLGKTRFSAAYRYFGEIKARLGEAYPWEIEAVASEALDTRAILLALVSRYYRLIGDFLNEVVRERVSVGLHEIESFHFRSFVTDRTPVHPELAEVAASTADKLNSVAIRMLREGGIIPAGAGPWRVSRPELLPETRERYCIAGTEEDLRHLLFTDEEIRSCRM